MEDDLYEEYDGSFEHSIDRKIIELIENAMCDDIDPDDYCEINIIDKNTIIVTNSDFQYKFKVITKDSNIMFEIVSITLSIPYYPAKISLLKMLVSCISIYTNETKIDDLRSHLSDMLKKISIDAIPIRSIETIHVTDADDEIAIFIDRISHILRLKNPFIKLMSCVRYCKNHLHEHCYICGRVNNGTGVHICNNELCRYLQIENKLYCDIHGMLDGMFDESQTYFNVLCRIIKCALSTSICDILLSPVQRSYMIFGEDGKSTINSDLMKSDLEVIISDDMKTILANASSNELIHESILAKTECVETTHRIVMFIWWILNSIPKTVFVNPAYFNTIHEIKRKNFVGAIKLINDDDINYYNFLKLQTELSIEKIIVYHGASIEKWLSIGRHGLQNLSNTKFMANGAVHGVGIYTSSELETAYQYAARSSGYVLVGFCELLPDPKGVNIIPDRHFYVVTNDKLLFMTHVLVFSL